MRLLDNQTVVVVDLETTGVSAAYGDRICEVGMVRACGDEILDTYQTLVNPQRPISPGAARVNGLSDEEVRAAPRFAEIAGQVLANIDRATLVCHNAPFDLGFLEAELSRLGMRWQPASGHRLYRCEWRRNQPDYHAFARSRGEWNGLPGLLLSLTPSGAEFPVGLDFFDWREGLVKEKTQ